MVTCPVCKVENAFGSHLCSMCAAPLTFEDEQGTHPQSNLLKKSVGLAGVIVVVVLVVAIVVILLNLNKKSPTSGDETGKASQEGAEATRRLYASTSPSTANATSKPNRDIDNELLAEARFGDVERVKALLDAGANIEARDETFGRTPLMEAALEGKTAVVKTLLSRGAEINAKATFYGNTALIFASGDGKAEVVRLLLAAGADINAKNEGGYTALDVAEDDFHKNVIQMLTRAGARKSDQPDTRSTADRASDLWRAVADSNIEKIQGLLAQGVDVDAKDENGWTGLRYAVFHENLKVVRLLLKNKADPSLRDFQDGTTALHWAAQVGNTEIVKALLESGADPNMPDTFSGSTPLMNAAAMGWIATVKVLLDKGADPNARDKWRESVLSQIIASAESAARSSRSGDAQALNRVIQLLRQAGGR